MKKHFILAAMTVAAIFTGCSNEEESLMPNANAPVSFVIDGPVTRTTTTKDGVTSFVEGDEIAMYSSGLTTEMAGTVFTVGAENALTAKEGGTFTFKGLEGATFYAYYPATATGTAESVTFTVAANQSTPGSFNKSDFMTSKTTVGAAQTEAISLQFAHRLTLVKVELAGIGDVTGVEMNNVLPTATWTYSGDNVATSGTAITIEMGTFNSEYWAVVPAQTITTGTVLFTIQAGGKTYTYKPTTSDIAFAEGKAKKFRLTIAADGQTVVSLNTVMDTAWEEDDTIENGKVTEEIKNYITFDSNTTIAVLNSNRYELANEPKVAGWGFINKANDTDTAENENGKIKVTTNDTQTSWSWWNRTLYFYYPETLTVGEYTLSFRASTSKAPKNMYISLVSSEESGYKFCKIINKQNNAYTGVPQTVNTAEEEYTFTIDTSKTITKSSPATAPETGSFDENSADMDGFYLAIAFQPEAFTLSDIQLIKK